MEQTDEKAALAKILEILNKAAVDPSQGQGSRLSRFRFTEIKGRPSPGALSLHLRDPAVSSIAVVIQ